MKLNQKLAKELNRPSCQDTGVMQFIVRCGTNFPLINELEVLLKEAVIRATQQAPLRHNSVETFDEYNTGKNVVPVLPLFFGRLCRTAMSWICTLIWPAAAAACPVKQWC